VTCASAAGTTRAYHARLFSSGWEGTGRVEACEPPAAIAGAHQGRRGARRERHRGYADRRGRPDHRGLGGTGDASRPISPLAGPGCNSMSKISLTTSPGESGATMPKARWNELHPAYQDLAANLS
jgi:hypothetical protein